MSPAASEVLSVIRALRSIPRTTATEPAEKYALEKLCPKDLTEVAMELEWGKCYLPSATLYDIQSGELVETKRPIVEPSKLDKAIHWLATYLANGTPIHSKTVINAAAASGIAESTLQKAFTQLDGVSKRERLPDGRGHPDGRYFWSIPASVAVAHGGGSQ
ncbi:MAG: hypothetical protein M3O09_17870 [Acidobacteriota bacterium]|nr:hypothetical protein [Acidobacteriota bacterium]